jgi:uncharacterized membrane protein YgdD (TMEM256/DUF423 family)
MNRPPLVLAAIAALIGAAGVGLAAAAVHANGGDLARTAALFLILHAAAALGIAAHARIANSSRTLLVIGFFMEAGAFTFAADLAAHAFTGARLFPYAAPLGGSTMILSWLALGLAFGVAALRPQAPLPAGATPPQPLIG